MKHSASGEIERDTKRQKIVAEAIENEGRGWINRGEEEIAVDKTLLSVTLVSCWSVPQALEDTDFISSFQSEEALKSLDPEIILALYVLFVRDHPQNYEGKADHLTQIPKTYTSALFYNESQLVTNSSFDLICKQALAQVEEDLAKVSHILKNWSINLDSFKWAMSTIQSRSMDFLFDGQHLRLLVPEADLTNHSFSPNARHQLNLEEKCVEIVSTSAIATGQQVFAYFFIYL
jgi:hypothetical protein